MFISINARNSLTQFFTAFYEKKERKKEKYEAFDML